MRKAILILSLIFLPVMYSEARPKPGSPVLGKKGHFLGVPGAKKTPAFGKTPLLAIGSCQGACIEQVSQILGPKEIEALNRSSKEPEAVKLIGQVVEALPAIRSNLEASSYSVPKAKETTFALLAAAIQSPLWKDPEAAQNILEVAHAITSEDPRAYEQKLEEARENCQL